MHVVFWECSLCEDNVSPFCCLSVPSRIALIFLILECIWRVCVLSLFNCEKCLLEYGFPGYNTLISVTPSLYLRFQWTFLLEFNSGFIQVHLAAVWGCYALIQEGEPVQKKKKRYHKKPCSSYWWFWCWQGWWMLLLNCSFPMSLWFFCVHLLCWRQISASWLSQFVAGFTKVN